MKPHILSNLAALTLAVSPLPAADEATLSSLEQTVIRLCEQTRNAIVRVKAVVSEDAPGAETGQRPARVMSGSGFFTDARGEIFTAASVVAGAHQILVEWQGAQWPATLVGADRERSNLAVLRIAGAPPQLKFPALAFGDSAELRVGSLVVMIGFPFEMPASPSVGFVGGGGMSRSTPLFTTQLPISPGQSGAPFFNARGQVVGMLYGGSAQQPNVAYALPARAAQRVAADLRQFGEPRFGSLGMSVQQVQILTQTNAPPQPAIRIIQVAEDTPAAKAGIQPGDLLLAINQRPMQVLTDVAEAMFYLRVGEPAGLQVLHSNQVAQVALKVMPRVAMTAKPQSVNAPVAPADPATPVIRVQPASAAALKP